MEKEKERKNIKITKNIIFGIVVLLITAVVVSKFVSHKRDSEPIIINESTLKEIIDVNDLSTFEAVYNGIAEVVDEEEKDKINYYVSYDAKVKAGVDFEKIDIKVNVQKKEIVVELPQIKITDVDVDITSLDYIFLNDRANTETVSEEAYKECIEDVMKESDSEDAIYDLAKQNAQNIIEALISPFVEQLDSEYKLQIV